MKKTILVLVALMMFAGIASASVESDSNKIRYDKCITELAKLDSLHYTFPSPSDFNGQIAGQGTYGEAVVKYNNRVKAREAKRAECRSLGGTTISSASVPDQKSTEVAQVEPAPVIDPVADHQSIIQTQQHVDGIKKTIGYFWILFGLIIFLLIVITHRIYRREK